MGLDFFCAAMCHLSNVIFSFFHGLL